MGISCVHGHYSHPHFIRARQAGQLPQEYRPQLRPQWHSFPGLPCVTAQAFSTTTCVSFASWSRRHTARGRRLDDPGVVGLWRSLETRCPACSWSGGPRNNRLLECWLGSGWRPRLLGASSGLSSMRTSGPEEMIAECEVIRDSRGR
jgi:hypothetical protein